MYRTLTVALAVAIASPAAAQTLRRPAPLARPAAPGFRPLAPAPSRTFRPIKIGPHTFYGAITSVNGTTIVVRTRRQRLVTVDAATVLAAGTYSAPLFVGKLVTVDGSEAANGVFTAAHIARLTNLNALPTDK